MTDRAAPTRYPGYDVLEKQTTPSWDEITRTVVAKRMATLDQPEFCDPREWQTLCALCAQIIAQRKNAPQVPLAALLDRKLAYDDSQGYRDARMPPLREAWRTGLAALEAASQEQFHGSFADLTYAEQVAMIRQMQSGQLQGEAWNGMPSKLFFSKHVLDDISKTYYSHPFAWSEIGFGGPANPRGYARLYTGRRDAWEAIELHPDEDEARVRKENQHVG